MLSSRPICTSDTPAASRSRTRRTAYCLNSGLNERRLRVMAPLLPRTCAEAISVSLKSSQVQSPRTACGPSSSRAMVLRLWTTVRSPSPRCAGTDSAKRSTESRLRSWGMIFPHMCR